MVHLFYTIYYTTLTQNNEGVDQHLQLGDLKDIIWNYLPAKLFSVLLISRRN